MNLSLKNITYTTTILVISACISILLNNYIIDGLLDTFVIMSYFSLVCNRVAVALLIYFLVDMLMNRYKDDNEKYTIDRIANNLMLIYFITLVGLLYGRHLPDDLTYSYVPGLVGNYLFVSVLVSFAIFCILYYSLKQPKKTLIGMMIASINPILIMGAVNLISSILSHHTPPNAINSFNFYTVIPKWLDFLHLKLVVYYLLGNILVSIPLGIYIGFKKNIIEGTVISLLIIHLVEFIQAITNLGYYDIDDLFLNGIGAFIGVLFIQILLKLKIIQNS